MSNLTLKDSVTVKYFFENLELLLGGSSTKIDKLRIVNFLIEHDYTKNIFPIIRIDLNLEPELYFQMLESKKELFLRVRFRKKYFDVQKEFLFDSDYINEKFVFYLEEDTPHVDKDLYKKSKKTLDMEDLPSDFIDIRPYFLFKENDIKNMNQIGNEIIYNNNMQNVVVYLLSKYGCSPVLMSKFENSQTYTEILLPPLNLISTLLYLEEQFGFYEKGSLIYYDIECLYFLNRKLEGTAYREKEYKQTVLTVYEKKKNEAYTIGFLDDSQEEKYYINVTDDCINVSNDSYVSNQINGNKIMVLDPYQGSISNMDAGAKQRGDAVGTVMRKASENNFTATKALREISELTDVLIVSASDFDTTALTPNKEIMVIFKNGEANGKYGGKYKLLKTVYEFKKEEKLFVLSAQLILKRYTQ